MKSKIQKTLIYLCLFYLLLFNLDTLSAQNFSPDTLKVSETEVLYSYTFCLLTKGKSREQSLEEVNKIQEGHMANLKELNKSGYLWLAGPFDFESSDFPDWRGLVILRAPLNQALLLMEKDPAVTSGRIALECKAWWCGEPWPSNTELIKRSK
jgi:uncharacterized protein YciI